MRHRLISTIALTLCCSSGYAFVQSPDSLQGIVTDATGSVVAGALVRVNDAKGVRIAETHTDDKGSFSFQQALPTDVDLFIPTYASFGATTKHLHLTARRSPVTIVLKPESVNQEVNVVADQGLSTDASANRDTVSITASDLKRTPIFDQDPIATLTPFLDVASGSSGGVTLIVDGMEVKSANISPSAIQEIRINSDPYSAEYTRPGRGRIEVISKPGSPKFQGEVNFTFRDAIFNAKNHFAIVRPPESRRIYEGHLSGPIGGSGKTSFLASFTRQEQDLAVVVNAVGVNGAINSNVLTPNRRTLASARVTHDFSDKHRLAVGYTFKLGSYVNMGVGGLVLPEAGYNRNYREDDLSVNDRLILTPNLINQLQIMLEKDEEVVKSTTDAPSISVNGYFVGGGAQADIQQTENTIHVNEILSWSHKQHYISAGVQLPQFSRRGVDDHTTAWERSATRRLPPMRQTRRTFSLRSRGRAAPPTG